MELHRSITSFVGRMVWVMTHIPPTDTIDIANMSKTNLVKLAEERGVSVTTRMTKAALIEAIEGAN